MDDIEALLQVVSEAAPSGGVTTVPTDNPDWPAVTQEEVDFLIEQCDGSDRCVSDAIIDMLLSDMETEGEIEAEVTAELKEQSVLIANVRAAMERGDVEATRRESDILAEKTKDKCQVCQDLTGGYLLRVNAALSCMGKGKCKDEVETAVEEAKELEQTFREA